MSPDHHEITFRQPPPVAIVRVGSEDYLFVKIPHIQQQPVAIAHPPYPPYPSTVSDRGTAEFLRNLLWIACGGAGLLLLLILLRPTPTPQPVIVQQPAPEKKRHTSKECQPSGLFGWGQVCESKEWWE